MNQQSPSGCNSPPAVLASRYLAECGGLLDEVLPALLDRMLARLDEALYDLADKTANNRLYSIYFDSMRIVRKQGHTIQSEFLLRLRRIAETAAADRLECDPPRDSLRLDEDPQRMPDTELEEALAIDNLVSKAESKFRSELLEMNAHLARLLGRSQVDIRCNPYGPTAICDALRTALGVVPRLQPPIKLVVYKTFDKQVMDRLGDFYSRCVALAVAGGHLRGIGLTHLDHSAACSPGAVAGGMPSSEETATIHPLPQTVSMPSETLQALLERQAACKDLQSDRVVLPTEELLRLLNNLGVRTLAEGDSSGSKVRERLSSVLAAPDQNRRALGPEDEAILDLVFLFFEHLLQGNNLPDPIKAMVGRLQIPIAKLALLDKGFFSEPGHPARRLLNHIGEAAVGWSEADGRGPDTLYGMIERVVERLILSFDGDLGLFAQMDRFFVSFLAYDQAQAQKTETQALAELTANIAASDQRAVVSALDATLRRYPSVPPVVESILRQGWLPVMLGTYKTQGPESPAWRSALNLAERLLWSVQPKPDPEERRQLLRRIPEMLRSLRAYLGGSGCDQRQVSRWFRDLQTLHLGVVQGESEVGHPVAAEGNASSGNEVHRHRPEALTLAVGSWIELTRDDGAKVRLKVAWHSPDGEDFLFVDRRGRRGPDLSRNELDALCERGLVELLDLGREPIADRALRLVLGRLEP